MLKNIGVCCQLARLSAISQKRCVRACWEKGFAKDLYHRRVLLGADPLVSRSAHPNWHYPSEISALSHRIGEPHLNPESVVRALTNASFFERSDMASGATGAQPSGDAVELGPSQTNEEFVARGRVLLARISLSFVRRHWPKAPEEFVCSVVADLLSDEALVELAKSLSLNHLVRTKEFPPDIDTLIDSVYALAGSLDPTKAQNFVIRFILPRLVDIELEDVLPFRYPLPILREYMKKWKNCEDVEPRELFTGGVETAISLHVVGIYANKELIGESPGEKLCIAVDLAAQDALLKLWNISNTSHVFPFNDLENYQATLGKFDKQNHSMRDVCGESIDLSLLTTDELKQEPYDMKEVAEHYKENVHPEVGYPHRKRLHHKFSRGTLAANTNKNLVRPLPHNI